MEPGFRFYPTEEELVSFYLHNQLEFNRLEINRVIPLLDIYQFEPWQLPKHCGELCGGDTEQWFFFVPRNEKEARGGRPKRTTATGYWKATGSPSHVLSSSRKAIGVKKSMVFYRGKAGSGRKTKWKMNEYRAIKQDLHTSVPKLRNEVSLCRVYIVSGSFQAFDRRPTATRQIGMPSEKKIEVHVSRDENNIQPTGESSSQLVEECNKENGEMTFDLEDLLQVEWEL